MKSTTEKASFFTTINIVQSNTEAAVKMVAYAIKDAHKADIGVRTLAIRFSTGASAKWLSEAAEDVTRWLKEP